MVLLVGVTLSGSSLGGVPLVEYSGGGYLWWEYLQWELSLVGVTLGGSTLDGSTLGTMEASVNMQCF